MAESDDIGSLLHDLRNQLTVAIGLCDHLVMEVPAGAGMDTASKVREACVRAAQRLDAWQRRHLMPFTYTIEPEYMRIVVPTNPTPGGFETTLQRILVDDRFRRGMPILYDRRAAPAPTAEYLDGVSALTHQYAALLGRCRWAVLVRDDDGETFSLVRNHAPEMAPSSEPWSFTDMGQALEWLKS